MKDDKKAHVRPESHTRLHTNTQRGMVLLLLSLAVEVRLCAQHPPGASCKQVECPVVYCVSGARLAFFDAVQPTICHAAAVSPVELFKPGDHAECMTQ